MCYAVHQVRTRRGKHQPACCSQIPRLPAWLDLTSDRPVHWLQYCCVFRMCTSCRRRQQRADRKRARAPSPMPARRCPCRGLSSVPAVVGELATLSRQWRRGCWCCGLGRSQAMDMFSPGRGARAAFVICARGVRAWDMVVLDQYRPADRLLLSLASVLRLSTCT